jgi:hypothetical protein
LAPTVGIAATGFCYPGGILQLFYRQDQQILWLPTAVVRLRQQIAYGRIIGCGGATSSSSSVVRSHLAESSAASAHHRQRSAAAGDLEFVKTKSMGLLIIVKIRSVHTHARCRQRISRAKKKKKSIIRPGLFISNYGEFFNHQTGSSQVHFHTDRLLLRVHSWSTSVNPS